MGKHSAFNKAIGPLRRAARDAADQLALRLPDVPLPPALPILPITYREVAWMRSVLAIADATPTPETDAPRAVLRDQLIEISKLTGDTQLHGTVGNELRALLAAVPHVASATGDVSDRLAAAVEGGALTASQAAHWRFRLGLADLDAARAWARPVSQVI